MSDKKTRKKELGKGIRALLATAETAPSPTERKTAQKRLSASVSEIPISQIEPNPFQPRTDWDEQSLQELANSIQTLGIIQPLTVRAIGPGSLSADQWRAPFSGSPTRRTDRGTCLCANG